MPIFHVQHVILAVATLYNDHSLFMDHILYKQKYRHADIHVVIQVLHACLIYTKQSKCMPKVT